MDEVFSYSNMGVSQASKEFARTVHGTKERRRDEVTGYSRPWPAGRCQGQCKRPHVDLSASDPFYVSVTRDHDLRGNLFKKPLAKSRSCVLKSAGAWQLSTGKN